MTRPQERYWPKLRLGDALHLERHFDGRVFPCFAERPANLWAMFAAMTLRGPDREAVVGGAVRLLYRELADRAERVAANLLAAGFSPGERIALLLGNRAEFVIAVLACARAGLIAVPLGTRQPRPEIAAIIADCAAAALIFDAPLLRNRR
jgi:acyl-CoA synthetase (AMP-forming)/AMP-acid ligase II